MAVLTSFLPHKKFTWDWFWGYKYPYTPHRYAPGQDLRYRICVGLQVTKVSSGYVTDSPGLSVRPSIFQSTGFWTSNLRHGSQLPWRLLDSIGFNWLRISCTVAAGKTCLASWNCTSIWPRVGDDVSRHVVPISRLTTFIFVVVNAKRRSTTAFWIRLGL